jgi:poly [ADP-ribose] polymerase 10/14/15
MSASEPFKQILLSPSSIEYKDVENNVMLTANNTVHQIVSIARIQNPSLYQQYMVRYDSMQRTVQPATATNPLERILWHGTSADTLESINSTGFNRSYCGKNAVVYGSGVYFAQQFSYSAANSYAVPDINGHKHVYQSRVLTGEFTTGHQSYRVPPNKPGGPGAASRFDSVVDNMTTPSVFVIFSDTQAYPEYLIIFK